MQKVTRKLVREIVRGKPYEYYALGEHVVAAPGICGGRPTFKYTRVEVQVVLNQIASGVPLNQLLENFNGRISKKAVEESLRLAAALLKREALLAAA